MIKSEHKNIHSSVIIGENTTIDCEKVTIGKYSRIGDNVKIKCKELIIGDHLYMANGVEIGRGGCNGPNSIVKIGNGVGIFENVVINPSEPVEIGDNCGIGADVMIWTHGAWLDITKGFPSDFGPVTIENDVWLPARCIVLPNVSIGANSVIGIASIVNKNIPPGSLAAGSPCKILKENHYPKQLSNESLSKLVGDILDGWCALINFKAEHTFNVNYDKLTNTIYLEQPYGITTYNVINKTIKGHSNPLSEDLRDYLRRRGIKIFTDNKFKSI